jgi:hypothetical protein
VAPAAPAGTVTREQALAALNGAVATVESIAGEHEAIALIGSRARSLLDGPGPFTCETVTAALNDAADEAKDIYNPDGGETSDTVIADSIGDLIVNLAAGWLTEPDCDTDELIARQWHDLDPDLEGFQVWNAHVNELGDHCPWSGQPVAPNREALMSELADDDEGCPQGCPGSAWADPEQDTPPYKAAIAATVKGWIA